MEALARFQKTNSRSKKFARRKAKNPESIDKRYVMMENQFASYDTIIGRLNRQFSTLQAMINAEINAKD